MSNKYLEKIAEMDKAAGFGGSAKRFVNDFTGSRVRGLEKEIANLPAESPMINGIDSKRTRMEAALDYAKKDRRKARLGTAAVYAAKVGLASGAYSAYKKYKNGDLQKSASMPEFFDHMMGKSFKENETMINALRKSVSEGKDLSHYAGQREHLRDKMWKARTLSAAGGVGLLAGGAYGLHKFQDHQHKEMMDAYSRILQKQAGLFSVAKSMGKEGLSLARGSVRAARNASVAGAKNLGQLAGTAQGKGFRDYAASMGLARTSKSPFRKEFEAAKTKEDQRDVLTRFLSDKASSLPEGHPLRTSTEAKIKGMPGDFDRLKAHQLNARIALGGIAAVPAAAYLKGRKDGTQDALSGSYY